jgi:hypothetical protein
MHVVHIWMHFLFLSFFLYLFVHLFIHYLFIYLYIYMYYVLDSSEKLKTCYFSEGYSIAVHQVISDEECCALVRGPSHWGFTPSENDRTVSLPGWGMYTYIYIWLVREIIPKWP